MDAPFNARSFSDCLKQVISAVVCPAFECGFRTPLACMVSVDQVQIVDASTRLLASIWFSQPRLMTVVPYSPSPFSHCRFTPTHGAKLMQPAVEFDNFLLWLLTPKQYGQACLPVRSPPAYEACAPAFWQAMIQVVDLSGWPNG